MSEEKWRVTRSVWGDWLIFPPGFPWLPKARAKTFKEAIRLLSILQCEHYMMSRRWRDG